MKCNNNCIFFTALRLVNFSHAKKREQLLLDDLHYPSEQADVVSELKAPTSFLTLMLRCLFSCITHPWGGGGGGATKRQSTHHSTSHRAIPMWTFTVLLVKLRGFHSASKLYRPSYAAAGEANANFLSIESVVWSAQRVPTAINLGFIHRRRYFSIK
jgi:hypothetical protein